MASLTPHGTPEPQPACSDFARTVHRLTEICFPLTPTCLAFKNRAQGRAGCAGPEGPDCPRPNVSPSRARFLVLHVAVTPKVSRTTVRPGRIE